MKEIERKYLVNISKWNEQSKQDPIKIIQGYLIKNENIAVRVRLKNDKAFLTIKGNVQGIVRDEFEYSIPSEEAKEMLKKFTERHIEKLRYEIQIGKHLWEIDEFKGKLEGLVLAEVELNSEDEEFEKPEWIAEDVSTNPDYFNAVLIEKC